MASEAARAIEAILMVADTPIDANLLAQVTEVPVGAVEQLLDELALSYDAEDRGFVLAKVAGGYRFQSHPDLAPYVERFVLEGQTARLSAAALETLAIVAYKQPISRAQVAAIRGVNVDGVRHREFACCRGHLPPRHQPEWSGHRSRRARLGGHECHERRHQRQAIRESSRRAQACDRPESRADDSQQRVG